jgi:opacity protein-like surface antigen
MEPAGGLALLHGSFQQEASSMRKIMLTSVCAAVIGLSAVAASAQTSTQSQPAGAPAAGQTNAAGPATTGKSSMDAMNKTSKKKSKKETKSEGGMEKGGGMEKTDKK